MPNKLTIIAIIGLTASAVCIGAAAAVGGGSLGDSVNQASMKAEIAGTGTITANGKIDDLDIKMAGVGHADFGKVANRSTRIQMAGIGGADIAPTDSAMIEIAGLSTVNLYSNPKD